jgi:hypothetical protein
MPRQLRAYGPAQPPERCTRPLSGQLQQPGLPLALQDALTRPIRPRWYPQPGGDQWTLAD